MSERAFIDIRRLSKSYQEGRRQHLVQDQIELSAAQGEFIALLGASGSGKSTLLNILSGIDLADSGQAWIAGQDVVAMDENQRTLFRRAHIGFVFQFFNLLPTLSALENAMVPLELRREPNVRERAIDLLDRVGLGDRLHHYPAQLSGGEQQRVALARAFINRPALLFADEPTGNLDDGTSSKVRDLLFSLNEESGATLILVTHDLTLARLTQRIIRLQGGRVADDQLIT